MKGMKPRTPIFENLTETLRLLRSAYRHWKPPIVGQFAQGPNAPFKALASTLLSLRTKDKVTEAASERLFKLAETPEETLKLTAETIEKTIYPVGFYRTKSKNLLEICRILMERHGGRVPDDLDVLLTLPGVGRKTANLVLTAGFGKHGICVDTHVHRISNRWGMVRTKTPDATEEVLRRILPKRYWIEFNELLVAYGQNLCVPVSPFCSRCPIRKWCPRKGVTRSR